MRRNERIAAIALVTICALATVVTWGFQAYQQWRAETFDLWGNVERTVAVPGEVLSLDSSVEEENPITLPTGDRFVLDFGWKGKVEAALTKEVRFFETPEETGLEITNLPAQAINGIFVAELWLKNINAVPEFVDDAGNHLFNASIFNLDGCEICYFDGTFDPSDHRGEFRFHLAQGEEKVFTIAYAHFASGPFANTFPSLMKIGPSGMEEKYAFALTAHGKHGEQT
ncbi:hypothetical protein K6V98_05940 [Collinsella sp. AGMB00827]|uniref:DUF4179 domain-containing protein n=1 Tax=Collinsella ureilytica TaxID=2869515 RepID=A0ABS7MLB8_9ACTN|nr:hypothetical protein [Collinsella urealyticum]MBY4797890.1 hypothetical protein [Collinsella urealyticum]